MLLQNKTAVIYGAGGAVGGAVARAFAHEGAQVFLAGRTRAPLDAVAQDITTAGGVAHVAQLDALDAQAIDAHLRAVVQTAGHIDISFNLIGLADTQGLPLTDMALDSFRLPVVTAITTHFLTATAAIRHMAAHRSGVILALTATVGRAGGRNAGGFGVACAAIEGLCRQLAAEAGPQGIRVVCLRSAGSPDAPGVDEVFHEHAKKAGLSRAAFEARLAESTLLKRLPTLTDVADVAVLMASERARTVTGAIANVTCGEWVD